MRPPAGPDQRKVRGELRRDRILQVATVHFGRRGYGGARLVDIAAEAGVTDAGLLHHFPTKKALFEAVVARRDSTYAGMWDPANVTARQMFDAYIEAVRIAAADRDLTRFRGTLSAAAQLEGHPAEGYLAGKLEQALAGLVPFLEACRDRGELRADLDPTQVVLEVLAMNSGLRELWLQLPEKVDYPTALATAVNGIYERIRATDAAED
ncbi:TetR family transcriptional regulator [Propionicimonas paludicola]|uniref:TetR family transcriptional regulator n=1 Tax=Propionicimonas paludicola TaxID=185243 RepID=A0A2A9CNN4_9ACTN|nr:TetR/AcrR family transcriptional regulator [Propionicimonas paludicola]PFG16003.1 TetR family transcriptional regulator [Propionicimonas paludicola]